MVHYRSKAAPNVSPLGHGRIIPRDGGGVVLVAVGKIPTYKALPNTLKCGPTARNKKPHSVQFRPGRNGLSRRKQGYDSPWGRHFLPKIIFIL